MESMFTRGMGFKAITIDDIINIHQDIIMIITGDFRPLPAFRKYLEIGYLPIIIEGEELIW